MSTKRPKAKIKTAMAKILNAVMLWFKLVKIKPKAASLYLNKFMKSFKGKYKAEKVNIRIITAIMASIFSSPSHYPL